MAEDSSYKKIKRKSIFAKLIFFLFVLIFLILLLEVTLRITYPLYSNFNTEMWRYSKDIKTLSDIPNVSHIHLPNKQSRLYNINFSTNSLGFRDYEYSLNKTYGVKRILVLGDSVTLGWGINLNDTYTKVLEKMLNNISQTDIKYEVINTAVGNYNTQMEVDMLEQQLYLKPDIIVVGFFPNDAEKTLIIQDDLIYRFKRSFYIYPFFWDKYTKLSYLFASKNGNYTSKVHSYYSDGYNGKKNLEMAFSKLKYLSENNNFKVYIVIIPQFYNEFNNYDLNQVHFYVTELCKNERFICIDTLDEFKSYYLKDIIISYEDAHPNSIGHKIIAEKIFWSIINGK